MLTEALKRKYEKLEKLAKKREVAFSVTTVYRWPDDLSRNYIFKIFSTDLNYPLTLSELTDKNYTSGLNRLMREIKAYPVVG
jgi:hypothetical protein